jgi:hypothetical protein
LGRGMKANLVMEHGSIMLQGTSSVTPPSGTSAINLTTASSLVITDDVQINSVDQTSIYIDKNSVVELNDNVAVIRSDGNDEILVDPTSALRINGSDITLANVGCEGITSYVQDGSNNSVNISNTCNGYQNLIPNFIKINSGNCLTNGYENLISGHQCSLATGHIVSPGPTLRQPLGCVVLETGYSFQTNDSYLNSTIEEYSDYGVSGMWCKE